MNSMARLDIGTSASHSATVLCKETNFESSTVRPSIPPARDYVELYWHLGVYLVQSRWFKYVHVHAAWRSPAFAATLREWEAYEYVQFSCTWTSSLEQWVESHTGRAF